MYLAIKFIISAALVVAISEIAKRYSFAAAVLASLPITSILAFIWLYLDTGDTAKITALSYDIAWLVVPSLVFFIALPLLLKQGMQFWLALLLACAATAVGYAAMMRLIPHIRD